MLAGVSCTSGTDCTAVGAVENRDGTSSSLAEHWNGFAWANEPAPGSGLTGVSCVSATFCFAVGGSNCLGSCGTIKASIDRWNGTTWTSEPVPLPPSTYTSALNAVSCASVDACTAVGQVEVIKPNGGGSQDEALAERWNGTSWIIESTAPTSQNLFDGLTGVSCPSTSFCAGVGQFFAQAEI